MQQICCIIEIKARILFCYKTKYTYTNYFNSTLKRHLVLKILKESKPNENSVTEEFSITASDGKIHKTK